MTLAPAITGAALSVFNTAMHWWQWRHSGPRIRASLRAGWYLPSGEILSFEVESFHANPCPDGGRPVVLVEVTNLGRSAADINEWWVTIGPVQVTMPGVDPQRIDVDELALLAFNKPLPFRLDSHASKAWVMEMKHAEESLRVLLEGRDTTISAIGRPSLHLCHAAVFAALMIH